ncbi:MAG: hypothetical protein M0P59_05640 [Gallionella sp.]|jgi:hypothetical protein|nr:hypothetical protein [Gallionella sp.]MCK9353626.1 hypothetical protein [Gallionella sp.]
MKTKFNFKAALISVALLGGSITSGAVYSSPFPLLKANGVSTAQDATDYYRTIDPPVAGHPNGLRYTQAEWREVNGFNDPANEIVVVGGHKNVSDLGFWRRIEMVIDKRWGKRRNVAFTTYNFEFESDTTDVKKAKSIVNMEYSPGPNGDRITKFYIYNPDGTRKADTFFDPDGINDLTKQDNLNLPNGCAACHGGGEDFRAHSGKTDGGFLAFDFNVFEYGTLTSRAANEPNVKKLNQGVLMTDPPSAVKNLIYGLYGGKSLPLATQNSDYMPSDWATEPALWKVVVTDCLGCHTLSESSVLNLNYWKLHVGSLREQLFEYRLMPNSPYANRRFWNMDPNQPPTTPAHSDTVRDALKRFRP